MDTSVGAVTDKVAEPVIEPNFAWIVEDPGATPVARPLALIVAAAVAEEDHNTDEVITLVLPLVYVPVALNCCDVPAAIEAA